MANGAPKRDSCFDRFADIWSKTVDKAYSINQKKSNVIFFVFLTILLGHARSQATLTLSSVLAYFTLLVMFFLTNGILNIGFVASIPPVFAFFVFSLVNSDCTIKSLYRYTRYVFCFVLSKLIYDVVTNLSGDGTNSFDYGPSGFVYMNLLRGNYYFVLKFVHLTILTLLSFIFVKLFPSLFGDSSLKSPMSIFRVLGENMPIANRRMGLTSVLLLFDCANIANSKLKKLDKYIVAFLCALPVATSFTQIFYLASNTINPIECHKKSSTFDQFLSLHLHRPEYLFHDSELGKFLIHKHNFFINHLGCNDVHIGFSEKPSRNG
ncbi:conserved Plasmodium protein, unknown function [Plasmodium ovale curtisi]|uniref:Uncharacterized protein n=1 Tax=Plasmodium ovale curtisi TaxID=864141 RepID=A0A1A8WRS6_PLAOA|nr:conserved Plasmodium protein, unknown function [Plasmodium ovale curtisi]